MQDVNSEVSKHLAVELDNSVRSPLFILVVVYQIERETSSVFFWLWLNRDRTFLFSCRFEPQNVSSYHVIENGKTRINGEITTVLLLCSFPDSRTHSPLFCRVPATCSPWLVRLLHWKSSVVKYEVRPG